MRWITILRLQLQSALQLINKDKVFETVSNFGKGNRAELFLSSFENENLWAINYQKQFRDLYKLNSNKNIINDKLPKESFIQ